MSKLKNHDPVVYSIIKNELERQRDNVIKKLKKVKDQEARKLLGQELDGVRTELTSVREEIRAAIVRLVNEAQILAATLSRFSIDDRRQPAPRLDALQGRRRHVERQDHRGGNRQVDGSYACHAGELRPVDLGGTGHTYAGSGGDLHRSTALF